jgi:two-component system chemotaxis sensor kinase CheA
MNEFIEQFAIESRELVDQATADLLSLEGNRPNAATIDSIFRTFHTLKGAAGIVEFAAMETALHAAETKLSDVRATSINLTEEFVSDCLACLNQVTQWIEEIERSGEIPRDAREAADKIVERFKGVLSSPEGTPSHLWLDQFLRAYKTLEARTAFHYVPDAAAFFQPEDPLALVKSIPDLITVDVQVRGGRDLRDYDPFDCRLDIGVLTKSSAAQVRHVLHTVIDQVVVYPLLGENPPPNGTLSRQCQAVLLEQISLLELPISEGRAGRITAAGKVAASALRSAGLISAAASIERALLQSDFETAKIVEEIHLALGSKGSNIDDGKDAVKSPVGSRVLRVDMDRVDALVNIVSELTVVKNALGHIDALAQSGENSKNLAPLIHERFVSFDRLVGELQRAVLKMRVLPLSRTFQRFPRLVRETSLNVGKPVKFTIEGDETEADATIVDMLFEPLLHVLRNAIDHGVEEPSKRTTLKKSEVASITLRAKRHLENVIVEVEDDGSGIDLERIRQVAVSRNVVPRDRLASMSDDEIVDLIFAPGFSTSAAVTELSGRGVGMDSVRTSVEKIGGYVNVQSRKGEGTVVRLSLPFSVMITRVMTLEAAGQIFGFPIESVLETIIVSDVTIQSLGAGHAFQFRNQALPLVDLAEMLGLPSTDAPSGESKIVVVSFGGQLGGVRVDRLGERLDVMLKPLGSLLQGVRGVAGTTLLGDGRVLVVLDVQDLFR